MDFLWSLLCEVILFFFIKLFKTNNTNHAKYCQQCFAFDMLSDLWQKRVKNFWEKIYWVPCARLVKFSPFVCLLVVAVYSCFCYHAFCETKIYVLTMQTCSADVQLYSGRVDYELSCLALAERRLASARRRWSCVGEDTRHDNHYTACLEQSTGRDPLQSQPISGCLQTFTQNSLLYSVFLLTLFIITFSPHAVDIVKCPWSIFLFTTL